ncbi:MAG: preprotein translocase subunit SecF, partial [Desulfobulbaceae bacterium A2]
TGDFTHEEATDLAIVLRVGALPAPVDIIQNLSVGASLGQDSIRQGMTAGIFGTLMVVVFMLIYYRLSGLIANVAMMLNIFFLFVGLAMLGSTLTLPGIAGIVLSIGMAVDANVLIYERMREEFALGKSIKSGVEAGFAKAFWTIVDAHVTTLITALALFLFGTGPIKGFAVTLSLGILSNLFAVLFCSRLAYDIMLQRRSIKNLKFLRFLSATNFDFMRVRRFTFAFSAVLTILGLVATVQIMRGHANLGVDFTGGSLFLFKAGQEFNLDEVRPVLRDNGFEGADLQRVEGENRLIVKIKRSETVVREQGEAVTAVLQQHLPTKGLILESQSEIGSSISAMLRNTAFKAIGLSLLGIMGYLALRFDLRFGVAATIATFHDVLAVLGVCWLMNVEITLLIITALLTLAGYSLNDTVVIFDRIREIRNKQGEEHMNTVINLSVNQTLSRSIITVLTVFFTVLSLYLFGGAVIHDFAFALLLGLLVGSYSSVFIASPLLTIWPRREPAK